MTDTIDEALNSFYIITFIFGFGILRYPLNYPRVRLSILYILSVWSVYAYSFYYVLTFFFNQTLNFMMYFQVILNLLVSTITIIVIIRKHKKFCILINKLNQVNDTLEELGVLKEYDRMRNSIKLIIIVWFIIICIILSFNYVCAIQVFSKTKAIIFPIVLSHSYFMNYLIDTKVMFLLRYIGTRYDKINDLIKQLSETEECELTMIRKCKESSFVSRHYIRSTENRKHILWITMHLHSQLRRIALDINGLFEIRMTLQTMFYLLTITLIFYMHYDMILCLLYNGSGIQWKCLIAGNMMCVFELMRLISFNCICESVSAKAQKTESIIHRSTNLIYFAKAREEICQFVLQISLRPLKFPGMGFFYFGHKFLCKSFIWILSIIILVIQMDPSPTYQDVSSKDNLACHVVLKHLKNVQNIEEL